MWHYLNDIPEHVAFDWAEGPDPSHPITENGPSVLVGPPKNMHPPVRDQSAIGTINETIDASDGADLPVPDAKNDTNKDMTRQDGKDEADINHMLSRFGITQPRGAPTYGEWDDSIDLMSALNSIDEARTGYDKLPEELRRKFPSMEAMLTAVNNGSLVIKDEPAPGPKNAAGQPENAPAEKPA